MIETKALDLLLELVPFIFLRQQLRDTGCRSLSLSVIVALRAGVTGVSHVRRNLEFK